MSATLATASYIGATILFILSLGGLSNPESSRRGNLYGMIGMTIAVLATVMGPQVTKAGYGWIVGAMAVGAARGAAFGFFFIGAGFLTAGGGEPGCNSTNTGFGTRRAPSASLPSAGATTRTGTVCGW